MFEIRVLRGVFGPKRDEVTGGCITGTVHQILLDKGE
jgi:hypothetical protein